LGSGSLEQDAGFQDISHQSIGLNALLRQTRTATVKKSKYA
jgi:hypothetical protein